VLAPAPKFLDEDAKLFSRTPLRRVVLTRASSHIRALIADERLRQLSSLHLIADMELDDELTIIGSAARAVGLLVTEFRYPRIGRQTEGLFSLLRHHVDKPEELDAYAAWTNADENAKQRLKELAINPQLAKSHPDLENAQCRCRRLVLSHPMPGDALSQAPYYQGEPGSFVE
jgi:hypothetical protein